MSKRENDGEIVDLSKKRKPNGGEPSGITAAVEFQKEESSPAIFKLNAICCDDLFEWLSLNDLHSLGQTCKRMNRLTGLYFRDNFKQTIFDYRGKDIYYGNIRLTGFIEFVQSIQFSRNQWRDDFQFIAANCDSLRRISFRGGLRTEALIDSIKERLNQIEAIHFYAADQIELCKEFLKHCPNLKTLHIEHSSLDVWKDQQYPKLERFILSRYGDFAIDFSDNVPTFFQRHSHLQQLDIDYGSLLSWSHAIIKFNMKLDVLTILHIPIEDQTFFDDTCALLNELYDKGFYKRLKLKASKRRSSPISQAQINQIATLRGLETFSGYFEDNIVPPMIVGLKELGIFNYRYENIDEKAMAIAFPNLRRIFLDTFSKDQWLPFIRRFPKLKELDICHIFVTNECQIDLSTLNRERKKLAGACTVSIYLIEEDYLKTKMATKNLYANHDLIEIKRTESSNMGGFFKGRF